jgi:hypothetical protein
MPQRQLASVIKVTFEHYGNSMISFEACGISLKHCTATFDGTRTAVEYICDGWGNMKLEPQAGVAVYESEITVLFAARIYDDVTLPNENQ